MDLLLLVWQPAVKHEVSLQAAYKAKCTAAVAAATAEGASAIMAPLLRLQMVLGYVLQQVLSVQQQEQQQQEQQQQQHQHEMIRVLRMSLLLVEKWHQEEQQRYLCCREEQKHQGTLYSLRDLVLQLFRAVDRKVL